MKPEKSVEKKPSIKNLTREELNKLTREEIKKRYPDLNIEDATDEKIGKTTLFTWTKPT